MLTRFNTSRPSLATAQVSRRTALAAFGAGAALAIDPAHAAFAGGLDSRTGADEDGRANAVALVRRFHTEIWVHKNLAALHELLSPDFVSHASPPGTPPGPGPLSQFLAAFFAAFPDLTSTAEDLFGQRDRALLRWTIRGTHLGDLFGIPPTGKAVNFGGMDVLRAAEGRLVEHWGGLADQLAKIYQQIGANPACR